MQKGSEYYFLQIGFDAENNEQIFSSLTLHEENDIPIKWKMYGGNLSHWFPSNIDDAIVLKDNVFLFHKSSVRLTKLNKDWPEGCPKLHSDYLK